MNEIIKKLEQERMKSNVFSFRSGDTVEVKIWIFEGSKKRLQIFEGIVISTRRRGLNSRFTVRKISNTGEGVERIFYIHSPLLNSIIVKRYGNVRKSKLYYLCKLKGRSARIKERLN